MSCEVESWRLLRTIVPKLMHAVRAGAETLAEVQHSAAREIARVIDKSGRIDKLGAEKLAAQNFDSGETSFGGWRAEGYSTPNPAELERELLSHNGFQYIAELPRAEPGELVGRAWITSGERRRWEISRVARRAPAYALLSAVLATALHGERWLMAGDVVSDLIIEQQRLATNGETITIRKFRTLPKGEPLQPSTRESAARASTVAGFARSLSLDELPQVLSILRGRMSFVGPRPLLAIDHDLMVPPTLSTAERKHWAGIPRGGLWTMHFPGCRTLEPQSSDYLRTRYLADALYDQIACRRLDECLLDRVIGPYLRQQGYSALNTLLDR